MSRSLSLNLVTSLIEICRYSLSNGSTKARRIRTIDITTFAVKLKDIYGNFEIFKLTFMRGGWVINNLDYTGCNPNIFISKLLALGTRSSFSIHLIKVISERFQSHFSEYALMILR